MTACNLYGEIPESTTPLSAKDIDVTVSAVTDSAFTVTLAPKGEAAFYSYLVDQDDEAYDLSPEEIYFVDYSSVAEGTVCYAENPTYTFTVDAEPNSQYWIYAVSSATDGNVGKLTVVGVKTSDGVAPEIVDAECKDTTLTLTFSEDVKYDKGIVITAKYYASNYYAKECLPFIDDTQMMGVDTAKVTVEGNVATCAFPNLPNGAYYAPIVPDGAFVDYAGLKAEGFDNGFKYDSDKKQPVPQGPVYGHVAAAAFEPVLADTLEVMLDYDAYQVLNHPDKYYVSGAVASKVEVKVVETNAAGAKVTTETVLSGAPYYGAGSTTSWVVKLQDEPSRGSYVTITIPEKTFYDVYGNYNSEVVIGPLLYSYGYTTAAVIGTYNCSGASGFGPTYNEPAWGITIAESDNAKEGNVMVTSYYGISCKIYADFDTDLGTFSMPIDYEELNQFIINDTTAVAYYTYAYYSTNQKQKTGFSFTVTSPNVISNPNDFVGYYYEVYKKPAGETDPAKIFVDDNYVTSDYNVFKPDFTLATGDGTATSSVSASGFKQFAKEPIARRR